MWDWQKYNWTNQANEISKIPLSRDNGINDSMDESYEIILRSALTWVVITRIIIAHAYTITYIANFYSIITWSRGNFLFPWLAVSALKNFILEAIVLLVVGLLFLEKRLSGYLVCGFIVQKIVTLAPAVYNWLTMHALYKELQIIHQRKLTRHTQFEFHQHIPDSPNIILGMQMKSPKLYEKLSSHFDRKPIAMSIPKGRKKFGSIPNLVFSRDNGKNESLSNISIKFKDRFSRSLTTIPRVLSQNSQVQKIFYQLNNYVMEDSILTPTEKVKKIFNISQESLDNIQLDSHDSDTKILEIEVKKSENQEEKEEKISTCMCPSEKKDLENFIDSGLIPDADYYEDDDDDIEEEKAIDEDSRNFDILRESESTWPENWILKKDTEFADQEKNASFLLNDENNVQKCSSDHEEDYCPRFSSKDFKKSSENIKDTNSPAILKTNESIHSSKTWTDRLQIIGGSFESTLQQIDLKKEQNLVENKEKNEICRSWVLDGMSIKLVRRSEKSSINANAQLHESLRLESKNPNEKCIRILTDRKVQTEAMKFSDLRKNLETNDVEMRALREYNAKTLWRDKMKLENQSLNLLKPAKLKQKKKSVIKHCDQQKAISRIYNYKKLLSSKKNVDTTEKESNNEEITKSHIDMYPTGINEDKKDNSQTFASAKTSEISLIIRPSLREKIQSLDWSLAGVNMNSLKNNSFFNYSYSIEEELDNFDMIIEDIETIDSLQGAFSFDPSNRRVDFLSNSNSSGLYSVSEQIPNVIHEIIKTARLRILNHDCNYPRTSEVDYGDKYLQEMMKFNGNNNNNKMLIKSTSSLLTDGNVEIDDNENGIRGSFPHEGEMSSVQSWMDQLQELVKMNIIDFGNYQDLEILMNLPGFNQIRNLIDFIRRKFMMSVSTMTSRVSLAIVKKSAETSTHEERENAELPSKFLQNADSSTGSSSIESLIPEISLFSIGGRSDMSEFPET